MAEYDKNFTFRMPGQLRDAITVIGGIEDRSLSQLAEYLMWAGFERYCKEKRLLSAYEVKQLSRAFKSLLDEAGLTEAHPDSVKIPVAEANQIEKRKDKTTGSRKIKAAK